MLEAGKALKKEIVSDSEGKDCSQYLLVHES